MRGADVARGMRPNTSYPLRRAPAPRAPAFDQFSEEFYDRAGAKSLLTTANWHAEALEQRDLLRGKTWHPSYGVDFQRTQKLFRQANYAADALRRWRPQRDDPHKRTRRRRRPSTTGTRAVAFEPGSSKGWLHAATGAESAQEASQRFNLKDVEALAKIDSPPTALALAGAGLLLLAVREVPFEELTWPHFVKFVDRYGADALVAAVRSVDAREVPDFKRRALQHFLGDDEPDFSLVNKQCERAWFRADAWIRSVLYAADAAAAARVGADETARKASRQASREAERAKERPPERVQTPAGWPTSTKETTKAPKTGRPDIVLSSIMRPNSGPDPNRKESAPVGEEILLSTTTNYPTTYTHAKDLNRIASSNWLVTALKCNSRRKSGYVVRAYHPGARVSVELHVSQEDAARRARFARKPLKRWASRNLVREVEMMRINNKLKLRLPNAEFRPPAAAEARPFFLVRMSSRY